MFLDEGPLRNAIFFEVPKGSTVSEVAEDLAREGAIASAAIFKLGAKLWHEGEGLKFGSYEIPARASMESILRAVTTAGSSSYRYRLRYRIKSEGANLTLFERIPETGESVPLVSFQVSEPAPDNFTKIANSGIPFDYLVAIPEGLTSWQVVGGLRQAPFLIGEIEHIPEEGSLAPATYQVMEGSTRKSLLEKMARSQTAILEEEWSKRAPNLPIESKEQALILASIIEKETGLASERDVVSSVFVNRLKIGMRLQTDPTVIYGLTEGRGNLRRGLRKSELERETPYNTYVFKGLPPTPISNPGRLAIRAALHPAATNFLYFVADGKGGHRFATNLQEHARNVREWRRIEGNRQ
ncbi:MAG: endolytic transglycosylase MltG [Albidovulum sp.]|nr:endolytic transglycosylase MltG [Albidovulum sp.]